jgi:hypothetical protein
VDSLNRPVSIARPPLQLSLRRLAAVIVPLAAIEGLVYPFLLHDSIVWWLSYTVYLTLGVILPGTLVAQAFVRWRIDWLTWIGLGWALGHVLEVVAIQLAKVTGVPRLFLLWIPVAYILVWRKRLWRGEVLELIHPKRCALLLAIVLAFSSATFVSLNLLDLSPQPNYQSDVWFHINEAYEFRDHLDTADPRIAGQSYAYHTLEYGPAVGANLAVQVPLANLIARYSGLSMVWLLVLLLFNTGRNLSGSAAGFLAAALIVAPLDVFSLVSAKLSFGSSIIYTAVDLSTSTLVGFWAIAALFLPLRWLFRGGRLRDLWVIALLAYMADGSKSVPGPLLLVAALTVIVGTALQRRRLSHRSVALIGVFGVAFCLTAVPILLRATVVDSATITFASAAHLNPFADQLTRLPNWLRLGFYPIGLALLLWVGVAFGLWRLVRDDEQELSWFLAGALLLGAVVVDAISIPGHSELFFLYMAMVLVAPVAGMGLHELAKLMWRGRRFATPATAAILVCGALAVHLKVGGASSAPFYDGSRFTAGLSGRIGAGVRAYLDPGPPTSPKLSWSVGSGLLLVTPQVVDGLAWLRGVATPSTVIATNVPDAALYAGLCECREYLQTEEYAPAYIEALMEGTTTNAFADRKQLLTAWILGQPGGVAKLTKVGITYLIVDHVNGFPIPMQGMPNPVFSNTDISIYRL